VTLLGRFGDGFLAWRLFLVSSFDRLREFALSLSVVRVASLFVSTISIVCHTVSDGRPEHNRMADFEKRTRQELQHARETRLETFGGRPAIDEWYFSVFARSSVLDLLSGGYST